MLDDIALIEGNNELNIQMVPIVAPPPLLFNFSPILTVWVSPNKFRDIQNQGLPLAHKVHASEEIEPWDGGFYLRLEVIVSNPNLVTVRRTVVLKYAWYVSGSNIIPDLTNPYTWQGLAGGGVLNLALKQSVTINSGLFWMNESWSPYYVYYYAGAIDDLGYYTYETIVTTGYGWDIIWMGTTSGRV